MSASQTPISYSSETSVRNRVLCPAELQAHSNGYSLNLLRIDQYKHHVSERFDGVQILGPRREKEMIDEKEARLLSEARVREIEPVDNKSRGFELLEESIDPSSSGELSDYLDRLKGARTARLVLRAGGDERRRPQQIQEEITVNLDFNNQRFLDLYSQADQELAINSAAFSLVGYAETAFNAYQDSLPMVSFMLEGDVTGGFSASYRGDDTVIESMSADTNEGLKYIRDTLEDAGAEYAGVAMEGEKHGEWLLSDYDNRELQNMI